MFYLNIMINESLLIIIILAIIYFKNIGIRYSFIILYLSVCAYYYLGLKLSLGVYGLFLFLVLLLTGIIKNSNECINCDHGSEHFKNNRITNDEEKGIEQFGIADKFSELHNMIHKLTKPK
jgi:hypothetical protein